MTRATSLTAFRDADGAAAIGHSAAPRRADLAGGLAPDLSLRVYSDLVAVESEWRAFERIAECTPFQSFEWLATWHRHIGMRDRAVPAIAVGRFADGSTAFIFPLAVDRRHAVRRLCWFGQDLCDYNAPLLSRDFSQRITLARFTALWRDLLRQIQSDPQLRHDWIEFEKMPETVGVQINPFVHLGVVPNANSAHIAQLDGDWDSYYRAKRSSATRRRDRVKRRHMAEFGDIRMVTATTTDDARRTLEILMDQKGRALGRKGITDLFGRSGCREFFLDFVSNPATQHLAHVSRLEIGTTCAAANFAIVFGDCYYHILASYCDGQLTRYGPGALHLRELLAYAIERGLRRFDFTIGDEAYKAEWCDLRLKLCDYSAAATWRGVPANLAALVRGRAKRFVKHNPLAWRFVCGLRATFGALTQRGK